MPSAYASRARSGPARYLVCSKVFSSAKIWWPEKVGRVCFFPWSPAAAVVAVAITLCSVEPTATAAWNAVVMSEMSHHKQRESPKTYKTSTVRPIITRRYAACLFVTFMSVKRYNFPPRLTSVSALPCRTGNTEITPFYLNFVCCFANKHKIRQNHHLVIDRLSFIHKTIDCMYHTRQDRAQSKAFSYLICIYSRRSPCLPWYRAPCQLWKSFSANVDSQWTLNEIFYNSRPITIASTNVNCYQTCCWWQFCL